MGKALASAHVQWRVLDPGPILAFTLTSPGTAPVGTEVWLSYPRTALYLGCSKPGGGISPPKCVSQQAEDRQGLGREAEACDTFSLNHERLVRAADGGDITVTITGYIWGWS